MASEITTDQMSEVSSWIHDERRCVSIGAISRNLGLSRTLAQGMLMDIAKEKRDSYEVTKVTIDKQEETYGEEKIQTAVFKLVATPFNTSEDPSSIFALCQNGKTESLSAAHEREMAELRDRIADNRIQYVADSTCNADLIAPAQQVLEQMKQTARPDAVVVQERSRPAPKKTTTSAASFFTAKKTATTKSNKKASDNTRNETTSSAAVTKKPSNKFFQKKSENEKENRLAEASKTKKQVGNADDFVGDLEDEDSSSDDDDSENEDDDPMDSEEDIAPEPRPRKVTRKARPPPPEEDEDVAMAEADDDSVHHTTGAMDAFATSKNNKPTETTGHRRRRKKLVEKTTTDASGYLHTETTEVWEDIPSDEEEKTITRPAVAKKAPAQQPAKKKKKAGAKTGMKQGNLMGFFKKK